MIRERSAEVEGVGATAASGRSSGARTYSFISLGCPKNTVDSERMLGLLAQDGYVLVPEDRPSDLAIVNTCGFIDAARTESFAVIRELLDRKRRGLVQGVIVAGCLAERQKDQLLEEVPEVDQVVGVFGREQIVEAADRILGSLEEQRTIFRPAAVRALEDTARLRITPRHVAYLKVSEGCDRLCTFCAIPKMRGKHVTKPMEQVVDEARELAADGVRELNLVAQDMTYYGMDLYGRPRLAELLAELEQVEEIDWIRILYNYPQYLTEELYEVLGSARKIVPYLDMPLQHINDRMLKRMNRRHTRGQTEAIIDRLRATIPGLVLRTTFIVGFPGETEEQFAELVEFVEQTRFQRLGVFTYSVEPDTPAAKLPDRVDEDVMLERQARLMSAQRPIAEAFNRSLVGRPLDILIDRVADDATGDSVLVGRSFADAPDVDGIVAGRGRGLRPGALAPSRTMHAHGYDLAAEYDGPPPRRLRSRPRRRSAPTKSKRVVDASEPSLPILN